MGAALQLLNPVGELEKFFEYIYTTNVSGYVCCATKDPNSSSFKRYYFEWPKQKEQLIENVLQYTLKYEVYYTPALFSEPSAKKEFFYGSSVLWTEFDGNAPEYKLDIPSPTLKIQTSNQLNQHWYWKLDRFITDISVIEDFNKRITYYLKGDPSVWDGVQVLRPPGTKHHSKNQTTLILKYQEHPLINLEAFDNLPKYFPLT